MYKCKICESELEKTYYTTRKKIIHNKVWRHQTINSVAEAQIERNEMKYSEEELNKKYYKWFCSECGWEFDGIKGIRNNTIIFS